MIQINFRNHSTVIDDAEAQKIMQALQIQDDRDFAPIWDLGPCKLVFTPKDAPEVEGQWELILFDTSDQAGALGYHDITSTGDPLGKIFAKDDIADGANVSITSSHECMEMRVDPSINLCADNGNGTFYALEVADACEDDPYGYDITLQDGSVVKVSDFVTPRWFNDQYDQGVQYDFKGHITKPLQLLPNGYIGINNGTGWSQITAQITRNAKKILNPSPGHRRQLRECGRRNFRKSKRPNIKTLREP